jgi:hypothetical protein
LAVDEQDVEIKKDFNNDYCWVENAIGVKNKSDWNGQ